MARFIKKNPAIYDSVDEELQLQTRSGLMGEGGCVSDPPGPPPGSATVSGRLFM